MTMREQRAQFSVQPMIQPRRQEQGVMPPLPAKRPLATSPVSRLARTPLPPSEAGASRHRAGHFAGIHPEDQPFFSGALSPAATPHMEEEDEEDDDGRYLTHRSASSVIRRRASVIATRTTGEQTGGPLVRRRSAGQTAGHALPSLSPLSPQGRQRRRLLLGIGLGMCSMGALLVTGEHVVAWLQRMQDDAHYGNPRTFQIDMRVGHDDEQTPSHFIAENLHGHILVIELPGDDLSKGRLFSGPSLLEAEAELIPVTLQFRDVNDDDKLDMIVCVQDSRIVFLNENGTFRPQKPDEKITL